ncbi:MULTISPECIES: hypothetical protein [Ralstonia solanacearum species complex]|uniref:Uncharacterized protein n=1 Tax=Ralstonia syzygii TaxID=28097 RepID=A0ABX7ZIG7_9RALS|nr:MULTISPECIES: hypothetical protein [Ralstonia solanacearum species complex]AMP38922.1 hypothetical protein LBM2029_15860 [Ralstonia solanacearum]AXV87748.1 hypothetical protein CJO78_16300 [Ralstonia solanacearum]AXW07205.1 hypothetical protein CJO82_15955 [Ralstonia solanacearum]AXW24988.1 hypothetical protein CJO86_16205 [Ralstonia solanacearum]AXW63221.1 hypothetical protein CJO94_16155 [Ralstonia solanacearum]
MRPTRLTILPLLLAATFAHAADKASVAPAAPMTVLRVEHHLASLGADGVQRDARFAERVYRQGDRVWIARELPAAAVHADPDHDNPHAGHKHAETDTAPRWIERGANGALDVRVVSEAQQKTYRVAPAEYGNIGFDGSWATAYHLLDPASLKAMRADGPARNGVQTYRARQGERTVTVDWDVAGHYPRRVESRNASGTQRKLTRVSVLPTPAAAPWTRAQRYASADYTDLMD